MQQEQQLTTLDVFGNEAEALGRCCFVLVRLRHGTKKVITIELYGKCIFNSSFFLRSARVLRSFFVSFWSCPK